MKLSTRGRYGIHAMFDLAEKYGQEPQPIKAIAERRGLSEAYLEQLFAALRREGLVQSVRGAQGGYRLSRAPAEISVGDMLRALEGGLSILDCMGEEDMCGKTCDCPTRTVFQRVQTGLHQIVDGITLQNMLDDAKKNRQEEAQ